MTEIIEILDDIQGQPENETEGQGDLNVPGEDPEPKTAKEKAEMFLAILDVDGSGGITLDEFLKVPNFFCINFYSFLNRLEQNSIFITYIIFRLARNFLEEMMMKIKI